MKQKLRVAFLVIFTLLLSVCLFTCLINGAPAEESRRSLYVFGAAGISILLPAGFSFFLAMTLRLAGKLKFHRETAPEVSEGGSESRVPAEIQIPALVNALAEKRNLTSEEKEKLLTYLEEL